MANSALDTSQWEAALARLAGPLRTKLARSMAVAGGKVLRDEAKLLAPVGVAPSAKNPGLLRDSIYLAFKDAKSNEKSVTYAVTWNSRKAPHGHLVEFGHWQRYRVIRHADGSWHTDVTQPLASPKFVAAHPFLRPAFDSAAGPAKVAMIARGRERLPELLAGVGLEAPE